MTSTLVDSNVLIDIISGDAQWQTWSIAALSEAANTGRIIINPIILAEISIGFSSAEVCHHALLNLPLEREGLPWESAFLAGKAFMAYRKAGGQKSAPLPDFFIGAHAQVKQYPLLTRDAERYRTYFPAVSLIAP